MKRNVTYIFGAGASAFALPVVKFFNVRLNFFLQHLQDLNKKESRLTEFINIVKKILSESEKHSTIDTVAKKFFHQNDMEALKQLKRVLTVFFIYEQLSESVYSNPLNDLTNDYLDEKNKELFSFKRGKIDYRYDSFIASLLQPKQAEFIFPNEVSVITWNYDCQFELSYQRFHTVGFEEAQSLLNIFPQNLGSLNPINRERLRGNSFKILHLNGQAHTFYKKDGRTLSPFDPNHTLESAISDAINFSKFSSLTFSWERNASDLIQSEEMKEVIISAKEILEKTKILVVLGYSFPFFNRELDRELFLGRDFDKVYIQDSNAQNIRELFANVFKSDNKKIIEYSNTEQFLLPAELDAEYNPPVPLARVAQYFR